MPTVTAQTIADRATLILQDEGNVRWEAAELLGWINDGQREIFVHRRDSSSRVTAVSLAAGTKQSLPADGVLLLDIKRNAGTAGTTFGAPIRRTSMDLMDAVSPGWHTATASATIKNFMYDQRTPTVYYVYPPAATPTYVELEYAANPAQVAALGDVIGVSDDYANALLDYVLFRANSKDHEDDNAMARAQAHRALFDAVLGNKTAADAGAANPANPKG
jgi:hypothetical protein